MSAITDRIAKLIALAGSPNENEARSSAFQACKLIRENKLLVFDPEEQRPLQSVPDFNPFPSSPPGSPVARKWRAATHAAPSDFAAQDVPGEWSTPVADPRNGHVSGGGVSREPNTPYVLVTQSKYKGVCKVCSGIYLPGSTIWWHKQGGGSAHQACGTGF